MCETDRPAVAWERNVAFTIALPDRYRPDHRRVEYRVLFAALALAESAPGVHVAHRAVEQNAVAGGFDLAVTAFGCTHDEHQIVLAPAELELAARIAYFFREGRDWLDEEGDEPAGGAS